MNNKKIRSYILFLIFLCTFLTAKAQQIEEESDTIKDSYLDYRWYDRSSIFGGTLISAFNTSDSYFSNPFPSESIPGFEIGFNIVQRSERYYQYKVGASYQRLRIHEQLVINGNPSISKLNLNLFNAQITPLILAYRKKLFRIGFGVGGYGAYIFPPNNTLSNEIASIYTAANTKEYDYGFHLHFSCQYHYFFLEAKWLNSLTPYADIGGVQKKFGILGISINLLLP